MIYSYGLHPAAQQEYLDSASWYLEKSLPAAQKFVLAIEAAISSICANPKMFKSTYKHYHEFTLHKYPFTILYTFNEPEQNVVIIAIYHQKREPENKYR